MASKPMLDITNHRQTYSIKGAEVWDIYNHDIQAPGVFTFSCSGHYGHIGLDSVPFDKHGVTVTVGHDGSILTRVTNLYDTPVTVSYQNDKDARVISPKEAQDFLCKTLYISWETYIPWTNQWYKVLIVITPHTAMKNSIGSVDNSHITAFFHMYPITK